jgi:hypothetical protein
MRKLLLGVAAAAAFVTPVVATALPASATETCQDAAKTATFHATQPSGGGGNWNHTFSVSVAPDGGFTGTNVIVGLDAEAMVTVNEIVAGQITDKNSDGIKEFTVAASRDSGFYTTAWSVTDAPMNGAVNSMVDGTVSNATAVGWTAPLPITFTAPVFTASDTDACKNNHGEYVSGAAHAGVKGKALADIAKDVTLVGPYGG